MRAAWTVEELDLLLVALPNKPARRRTPRVSGDDIEARLDPVPVEMEDIPKRLRPIVKHKPIQGRRSSSAAALTLGCIEEGLSAAQALYLRLQHAPTVQRWGVGASVDAQQAVAEDVLDHYDKHQHLAMRCFQVDCPYSFPPDLKMTELFTTYRGLQAAIWPTRHRSMLTILKCIYFLGVRDGTDRVEVSLRDLEMAVDLARGTVIRWVHEAQRLGYITQVPGKTQRSRKPGAGSPSHCYLLVPSSLAPLLPCPGGEGELVGGGAGQGQSGSTGEALRDAGRHGCWKRPGGGSGVKGIGVTAMDVYLLLMKGKASIPELDSRMSYKRPTISRALRKKLQPIGAVSQMDKMWVADPDFDWDAYATEAGVRGRTAAVMAKVEKEREQHSVYREGADARQRAKDDHLLQSVKEGTWGKRRRSPEQ